MSCSVRRARVGVVGDAGGGGDALAQLRDRGDAVGRGEHARDGEAERRAIRALGAAQHVAPGELVALEHRLALDAHARVEARDGGGDRRRAGAVEGGAARGALRLDGTDAVDEGGRRVAVVDHGALVADRRLPGDHADEGVARAEFGLIADAPRLPEVGAGAAVAGVEELRQLVEVVVLRQVEVAVGLGGGALERRVAQRRGDVGGGEHAAAQRQVHARGEQRVDEAARVADEHVARPGQLARAVGPVADHVRPVDERGARE